MNKLLTFLVLLTLTSCKVDNNESKSITKVNDIDLTHEKSSSELNNYCEVPINIEIQPEYSYNLQSFKGADFIEITAPIDLWSILNGVFNSYDEILDELKYGNGKVYPRVHCDSIDNYKHKFYMPKIDFQDLTLIIFNRVWSDKYSIEMNFDIENKLIKLMLKYYYKKPITVTDLFLNPTWILIPKINDDIEVKVEKMDLDYKNYVQQ